ncbi:TetR/AcrR family transcriptional regulator [Carnobacteriaceae bacterium zg-ZUI252]|nr:TetR/AcrR family transcriptional regulator [Carnobacteriaceae bacterium zg-ZUI252]QTU83613.1 TetR/AcrR family transcriptional regulator [Carnobacteriaceae bacterium zg-C25]
MKKMQRQTQTKEAIKSAFIQLLQEKGFDAVTVSDLSRYAKVNRGTFYLHYVDKFDLVDQLVQEVFEAIWVHLELIDTNFPMETMILIFDNLKDNFQFIQVLSQRRFDYVNALLRQFLTALIEKLAPIQHRLDHHPTLPPDYAKEVFLSSNAGIIFHWLSKGGVESSKEIAQIFMANNM